MFSRPAQQILGAVDRLRSIHLYPEAREEMRERMVYYTTGAFLWPLSKLLKDSWDLDDVRDEYIRTTPEPRSLKPRRRGRRLTLERIARISPSPLLSLPREVRDVIWEYAVGDMQIHWWIEDRKLRGMVCRSEEINCQSGCRAWIQKKGEDPWPVIGVMGMLLTCKQIYSETIGLLYSHNTFDTTETDVMAFLPRILLPDRVNAMRNLDFVWTVSAPPSYPSPYQESLAPDKREKAMKREHYYSKTWKTIWRNLSGMEGLVSLRVELMILGRQEHLWEAKEFQFTRLVHRPQQFRLVLPESVARRISGKIEGSNCTVESIDCSVDVPESW